MKGNARYGISMIASSREYIVFLCGTTYASFRHSALIPLPNTNIPQHAGKDIAHYKFCTGCCPIFTELHALWYRWDPDFNKFIKIVPYCIAKMFSARSLAHWVMEDGYFDNKEKTVVFCTESFTKAECQRLQDLLLQQLSIESALQLRNAAKNTYRIRISRSSIEQVRELVTQYMHSIFMYKLGYTGRAL